MSTSPVAAPSGAADLAALDAAVAANPRDPASRRALGVALARAGKPRGALAQFVAILGLVPNDPDAAANAGLAARRCAREEQVLPLVRAAAAANPGHPRLWQVLGLMHRALDDLDPAIEALDRAATLAPADPMIAHGRARAVMEAGRPSSRLFDQALQLAPADSSVILGRVSALVAEGMWRDAVEDLRARLGRNPDWVEGHATLARLLWEMGARDEFTDSLEQALAESPANLLLWRELLSALMHADLYDRALDTIARGRAAAGPNDIFDANEAVCQAELGNFELADALFARLGPLDDATVGIRQVRHLLRSRRPEQAAELAESWLAYPSANLFWPYLATAWRILGDERWQWLEGDPRLVGIYDLAPALPSLDALADRLRSLHYAMSQPLEQSVRGGTQTDGWLFTRTDPEIQTLRAALVDAVGTHVAQLPPPDPRHPQLDCPRSPIRFSGSWSVRLVDGGNHTNHIHPAGWFSSAFYVALPEPGARGPEPAGWLALGEPQAELRLDLEPFRLIEPQPGRLALFPSTMWHGTRPFDRGERLTVAFDVSRPAG